MRKLLALIFRHPLIIEYLKSIMPEALRVDLYLKQRRKILEQPRLALTSHIKSPLSYACFGLIAPYAAVLLVIYSAEATGLINPSRLEQSINEMRDLIGRSDNLLGRVNTICQRQFPDSPHLVPACIASVRQEVISGRGDAVSLLNMLTYSQRYASFINSQTLLIQPIILIINAYIFAYIWSRFFPVHASPSAKDRSDIRRVYLITMGTTLFLPSILSVLALLSAELVERSIPWTLMSFAPTIMFFGLLPIFVAIMLVAQRLHRLLNKADDWWIARPIGVMLLSNFLTCLAALPLLGIMLVLI